MRRLTVVFAVSAFVAIALAPASPASAADPKVTVDRTGVAPGETMVVRGSGWSPATNLIIELCGHGGLRGSVDCDLGDQRLAGVGPDGTFGSPLTAGQPPSPCPCVVKVTDQTSHVAATAPIAVQGVPVVAIEPEEVPVPRIEVTSMRITDRTWWKDAFGLASSPRLELTLVNTGSVNVAAPELSVVWGAGDRPTGIVTVRPAGPMAPGQTRTVTAKVHREALAFGDYTAIARVEGLTTPATRRVSTSGYPWGLLVVALVIVQILLVYLRNRLRRRIAPEAEVVETAVGDDAKAAAPDEDVIDLVDLELDAMLRHVERGVAADIVESLRAVAASSVALRADLDKLCTDARGSLDHAVETSRAAIAACLARADETRAWWETTVANATRSASAEYDATRRMLEVLRIEQEAFVATERETIERAIGPIEARLDEVRVEVDRVLARLGDVASHGPGQR
jgi:hypothetical protein